VLRARRRGNCSCSVFLAQRIGSRCFSPLGQARHQPLGIGRGGQPPAREEEEGTAQGSRERRASGAGRSGSEPARSSCGGGSPEAAQHSRTGGQGRPGGGATAGRVAGRSPWLSSPPPRLSRVASASRSPRGDESRGEAVRAARVFFSCSLRKGAAGRPWPLIFRDPSHPWMIRRLKFAGDVAQ